MRPGLPKCETRLPGAAIAQAKEALSNHFAGVKVQLDGPISIRENSEIFHAVIDTLVPLHAAVKHCLIPKTKAPDQSAAKEQFSALVRVAEALRTSNARYRSPQPIYLAPELAIFAMSWIDGESLTKKLRRPAIFTEGPGWFQEIGAWLGIFHKAGPSRRQRVDLAERLATLEKLCATPLPDKSFSLATGILQRTASALENIEVEASWLHGDCKTDNFILGGDCVYGIDLSLVHENPVEYDLAQFFNNLDLLFSGPQYLHVRGMRAKLEEAFWRGYRSTGPTVSQAYLDWLRLNFSLSFWHSMLNARKKGIRTWVLNRMFAKLADRLSRKISLNLQH